MDSVSGGGLCDHDSRSIHVLIESDRALQQKLPGTLGIFTRAQLNGIYDLLRLASRKHMKPLEMPVLASSSSRI